MYCKAVSTYSTVDAPATYSRIHQVISCLLDATLDDAALVYVRCTVRVMSECELTEARVWCHHPLLGCLCLAAQCRCG
jgi:hypothetical protein